jgi:hypothetical protein
VITAILVTYLNSMSTNTLEALIAFHVTEIVYQCMRRPEAPLVFSLTPPVRERDNL